MELNAPFNRCVECDEVITNPLCSECLSREMQIMVSEHDQQLAAEIDGFRIEGETRCICCGKNMGLCAHCFSRDVYDFLSERNHYKGDLLDDFVANFDFDLRRELV